MPKYLFRLDDICPTMHWDNFMRLKEIFDRYNVKPLIAVIPQNQDPSLKWPNEYTVKEQDFWELMRKLQQEQGWEIGQHGFQHLYVTKQGGLLKINKESEFAGLDYIEQEEKIRKGKEILKQHDISTDIFVAPSHSFDKNTCNALLNNNFYYISDGLSFYPYMRYGLVWIPQMLWGPLEMSIGIHTICLHPNIFKEHDFLKIEKFIQQNIKYITTFQEIKKDFRNPSRIFTFLNFVISPCWNLLFKFKKIFSPVSIDYNYAKQYQKGRLKGFQRTKDEFLMFFKKYDIDVKNKVVLDLAAGPGVDTLIFSELGAKNVLWHDKNHAYYLAAREILKDIPISYRLADMKDLDYPPSTIYFILCRVSLFYVLNQKTFFKNVYKILENNGFFYADTYTFRRLSKMPLLQMLWSGILFFIEYIMGKRHIPIAAQPKRQLLRNIKKSGLKIILWEESGDLVRMLLKKDE